VAGELGGSEQPGGAGADNQDVVSRHSITPASQRLGLESSRSPTLTSDSAIFGYRARLEISERLMAGELACSIHSGQSGRR
jgi:hypothetical protein